jgi:hypothetical protein
MLNKPIIYHCIHSSMPKSSMFSGFDEKLTTSLQKDGPEATFSAFHAMIVKI